MRTSSILLKITEFQEFFRFSSSTVIFQGSLGRMETLNNVNLCFAKIDKQCLSSTLPTSSNVWSTGPSPWYSSVISRAWCLVTTEKKTPTFHKVHWIFTKVQNFDVSKRKINDWKTLLTRKHSSRMCTARIFDSGGGVCSNTQLHHPHQADPLVATDPLPRCRPPP